MFKKKCHKNYFIGRIRMLRGEDHNNFQTSSLVLHTHTHTHTHTFVFIAELKLVKIMYTFQIKKFLQPLSSKEA